MEAHDNIPEDVEDDLQDEEYLPDDEPEEPVEEPVEDPVEKRKSDIKELTKKLRPKSSIAKQDAMPDSVKELLDPGKPPKRSKKELVEDCVKLQEQLHLPNPRTKSAFNGMNKPELQEILQWMAKKASDKLDGTCEDEQNAEQEDLHLQNDETEQEREAEQREKIRVAKNNVQWGAKTLFTANYVLTKCVELSSNKMRDKTGIDLAGLGQDVLDNREELEKVLAEIYRQNEELIAPYVSPVNQWAMVMLGISVKRADINAKKKLALDEKK
jgi:hypothetical protein